MTEQQLKQSNYSFFVDTYKAKNIARQQPSINYHFSAINENLSEVIQQLASSDNDNLRKFVWKAIQSTNVQSGDLLSKSISFGEAFKTALLMLKKSPDIMKLNNKLISATIYHYLELANDIKDKNINTLAIEIAKIAKKSN